jgi:hypothetical protein
VEISPVYEESAGLARDFHRKNIKIEDPGRNVLLTCPKIGGQVERRVLTCCHDETELQRNGRGDDQKRFRIRR